ncbi:MAG: signal transduction histidine kinase [Flavobacteriales bacterium]|jgi:signal transduction histidine kinase
MQHLITSKSLTTSVILIIFIIDLAVPPGTEISILYVVSLVISVTLSNRNIITAATTSTILAITDTALYYNTDINYSVFVDRALSISVIWISCSILLRYKDLRIQKDTEKEKYESCVTKIHFMVSHEIRSPLCRIQGLTNHINSLTITKEELESLSNHLKTSVTELDNFTITLKNHLEKVRVQNTDEKINSN